MDRIGSFSHHTHLMNQTLKVQARVGEKQIAVASGRKSQDHAGIAGDVHGLVSLENELTRSQRYVSDGETVLGRIDAAQTQLGGLAELANAFRGDVAAASRDPTGTVGLRGRAQSLMEEAAALMNAQHAGSYLFSGSSDTAPVDIADPPYAAATPPSAPDLSYYQGAGTAPSFRAADGLDVQYGMTAEDGGFEKLLRALNLVASAPTDPVEPARLQEAYDLAGAAVADLSVGQARLGSAAQQIERAIQDHLDFQLQAESLISGMRDVDVAAATADLGQLEAQLEASYAVIATLQKLNLLDYL